MKIRSLLAIASLATLWAGLALGQQSGVAHPPDGVIYNFRFVVNDARTTEVCLHEVDDSGALVDRDTDGDVDRADAFVCTSTIVADGQTVNRISHTFVPPLSSRIRVALCDYNGPNILPSGPSNWHQLVLQLLPSTLLSP